MSYRKINCKKIKTINNSKINVSNHFICPVICYGNKKSYDLLINNGLASNKILYTSIMN